MGAPKQTGTAAAPPIFVVGSPRSGTSLLRLILDSHPAIACGPESHFLADMDDGNRRFSRELARYGWDDSYWNTKYRDFVGSFKQEYSESKGKTRWADKTPRNALHLPFITSLFPDAQVIHIIRDARMVTASALARWGWRRAWGIPERWTASVQAAREAGAMMPASQYREMRFEKLLGDTEGELRALFAWLGEPWDPQVLDYDKVPHDEGPGNAKVREAARAAGGGAIDSRRASAPRQQLDPLLRARVQQVAGRLNRELGYR